MCGIAGIFTADIQQKPEAQKLVNMIQLLVHRGPDAQATHIAEGFGFAHARLSIIDPVQTSNQPMRCHETGNLLIFNGEIYNYIEVREHLVQLGHKFLTNSDTEVILKAYAEWGVDCQNYFNGMWAFALYDTQLKKLFLSRDRMGIKPLVFGMTQNRSLVFASEAKAIVHLFPEFRQVNQAILQQFIQTGFFACYEETFYQGLYNLMPGHYMLIGHGEVPEQKRYWQWVPETRTKTLLDHESIEQFEALLKDSIRLRFRSDVPVGSCLSGGLDSGTIVGLATEIFNKPIHTFSCIYPNSPAFDESEYIRASVEKFGAIPQYIEPTHDDLIALAAQSVYEQDGPTGGASVLSQRAVMQLAGQHVKVLLDGQGADEMLGGYHPYFYNKINTLFKCALVKPSLKNYLNYRQTVHQIKERTGMQAPGMRALLSGLKHGRLLKTSFKTKVPPTNQLSYMQPFAQDELNTLLLEHTFTNLTDLLHYEDRNSMAFSVESRLPFLDYRIVEYAFSLGHEYKIRGNVSKWMVHEVAKKVLPETVLHRKDKMGFSTPISEWFMQDNHMAYLKQLLDVKQDIYGSLAPELQSYLKTNYQSLQTTKTGDLNALWRLFTAHIWVENLSHAKPQQEKFALQAEYSD